MSCFKKIIDLFDCRVQWKVQRAGTVVCTGGDEKRACRENLMKNWIRASLVRLAHASFHPFNGCHN